MKYQKVLSVLLISGALAACSHNENNDFDEANNAAETINTVGFNQFVIDLIEQTDENAEPTDINNLTFEFDNEDEYAFNAIL